MPDENFRYTPFQTKLMLTLAVISGIKGGAFLLYHFLTATTQYIDSLPLNENTLATGTLSLASGAVALGLWKKFGHVDSNNSVTTDQDIELQSMLNHHEP